MKKIMFYCQHVLGMGHLVRSLEIVRGLRDFNVCFLNGGEMVEGINLPPSVEVVNLTPIKTDENFRNIESGDNFRNISEVKEVRQKRLLEKFDAFEPDILVLELFPFGRRKFAFELLPLLERVQLSGHSTKVVCSLRDILVRKRDQTQYEEQVCALMNQYFDLLLIHSDPSFQRLEETFSRTRDLKCDIRYTGFVAQKPHENPDSLEDDIVQNITGRDPLIIVSIGGGRVGYELLKCAIESSAILEEVLPHEMLIFGGPYMSEKQWGKLQKMVKKRENIVLRRFTSHFMAYIKRARLSISMAGYNTCMNILTTGVRALVHPFTGNSNAEQKIRAKKLEKLGAVTMITHQELTPPCLAKRIITCMKTELPHPNLDFSGVSKTTCYLKELLNKDGPNRQSMVGSSTDIFWQRSGSESLEREFRRLMDRFQEKGRQINFFLRDDDVDKKEDTLRSLLEITISHNVPVNLEIIPGNLLSSTAELLRKNNSLYPDLIDLHQHGWKHVNHEQEGRKCEFGNSRSFDLQYEDISKGLKVLKEIFGEEFYPAFTPPWNRCTNDTFKVLDLLGFKVCSKKLGKPFVTGYRLQEISITLDLYRWKGGPRFKTAGGIFKELTDQIEELSTIGILLHHKVMDRDAFTFLDKFIGMISQYPNVRFYTFRNLEKKRDKAYEIGGTHESL